MDEYAINVDHVSKMYKLYDRPKDRLFEALGLSHKKRYSEHYALHDVSFQVKKGETVGIIGTNGSGKSTILKIITGVLNPTEGSVSIKGRISALLELGAGFNMEYTGLENIYLNGTMIGFSKEEIDQKLDDIIKFADIGEFLNQPVKTYSSGMFVRLAFAVAINIDPEILIIDEALSVGDIFFQAKCYKKFEEFKKAGKTILFVSHDLSSVSKYCDRVILLNQGVKLSEGAPKEMVGLYKRIIVNQNSKKLDLTDSVTASKRDSNPDGSGLWKDHFTLNPNVDEYGTGQAEIVDFALVDDLGNITSVISKGTEFEIKSKVRFQVDIEDPIFTYTFKNVHGVAITGTNTMFEGASIGTAHAGEEYVATFRQKMSLQSGEYLLSISCTGYADGEFKVYHRLYDVCNVTVISDKDTVGFYDMDSKVKIERA
jgi:teichoic acid transport system ATP-binding protein